MKLHPRWFDGAWGWCPESNRNHPGCLRWLPSWLAPLFVSVWNRTHCALRGHDDSMWHVTQSGKWPGSGDCLNCCTPVTACTGKGRAHPKKVKP